MMVLGLEFGSTRIKAVLIDENARVLATGGYDWENILTDGLWSYNMKTVKEGLQSSYAALVKNYGKPIVQLDAIGISGMMHGYLAFDKDDNLLAPFRTWRNANTAQAAQELSGLFAFNVPMRWSVSQFYQSVLDKLPHVKNVAYLTTLSGYVHYLLTGKKVLGIGDASGMFPIDDNRQYNAVMVQRFNALLKKHGVDINLTDIMPKVLLAGEDAGCLTKQGALLLDPTGTLQPGCPLCPPEGDMQTGMVCTNCILPETANVSLGTSGNLAVILKKNLKDYYPQIDIITTPMGHPAALVHAATCTSVIDSWANLFNDLLVRAGVEMKRGKLYDLMYDAARDSTDNVGGIVGYNYLAGEPIVGVPSGAPMVFNRPESRLNLADFMQMQVYSAIAALDFGMDMLKSEGVKIDGVYGHGGYFKAPVVGQAAVSALVDAPVTVMENAGEGGAWGIALLALYLLHGGELAEFLSGVFADVAKTVVMADEKEKAKFAGFMHGYRAGLSAEKALAQAVQTAGKQ